MCSGIFMPFHCLLCPQKQEQIQPYQKAICRSKYGDFMLSIKEQIRLLLWTLFTLHLLRVRHAGFNSAWCHSTWFSQFEYCSIYFAVGRAMIFHLQFPYGFMLFHDSTEIPFIGFKMAGGDCCGQFACLLWMRIGFRAAERKLVFLCRSPFLSAA